RAGVITSAEADELVRGLDQIAGEIERGEFRWDPEREDVHMNVEARLTALVGPLGGKLHTGRSRNDQVATDLRLYVRRRGREIVGAITGLASVILERAGDELDTLMPAYTHLQRGQPSRLAHHLLAWQEMLWRDRGRLEDALCRLNECPLGSGAAAGTGFPLDRAAVARALEFAGPSRNSLDATASRDFLMEVAAAIAILGVHLSRIGEELVIWSSQEFGFVALADAFTTSSSMMPQKKNPDVAELVRGQSARTIGAVTALLVLEKGLCLGYGRDLQEDKRPIIDACDSAVVCLHALTGAIGSARFARERMRAALLRGHLCATDLADFLVREGMPFREAHHAVGGLVRRAEELGVELGELPAATLEAVHPSLATPAVGEVLDPTRAVERRDLFGGPARGRVEAAIAAARRAWQTGAR
ncbi:MAG TPA: argininosuccinate lyase, partial [Polyangiaceae bacterium]|nr:argininosuccinate lyase [Polyangiaceae bacterium]